jgi:hypothetical protein
VKEAIDPAKLDVGINKFRQSSSGGMLINCNSEADLAKIKTNVESVLGQNYKVTIPVKMNPRLSIVGVNDSELSHEDIRRLILENNKKIIATASSFLLKVVHTYSGKDGNINIVLEIDPSTREAILGEGAVCLAWQRCKVYDHIHIRRCYKCSGYGHTASKCPKKQSCPKCSGDHTLRDCCESAELCVNCKEIASRPGSKNVDYHHTAMDRCCPVYRRIEDSIRERTNYAA